MYYERIAISNEIIRLSVLVNEVKCKIECTMFINSFLTEYK